MIKVVGVRFRQAGKIYYFDPKNLPMKRGTHVIVETARGVEYGTVIMPPKQVADDEVVLPLKSVIRVATAEDERIEERNHEKERGSVPHLPGEDTEARPGDEAGTGRVYL